MKVNKLPKKWKERWNNSKAKEALLKIKSKKYILWLSIIFDLLFLLLLYVTTFFFSGVLSEYNSPIWQRLIYLFLVVVIYSCTKFVVVSITKQFLLSKINKDEHIMEYNRLPEFFLLNLLWGITIFLMMIILTIIYMGFVSQSLILNSVAMTLIVIFILIYPLANISHTAFLFENGFWKSYKLGFFIGFGKFKKYAFTYFVLLLAALFLIVVLTFFDFLIRWTLKEEVLNNVYSNFFIFAGVIVIIVLYLAHLYNRVYFLLAVENSLKNI